MSHAVQIDYAKIGLQCQSICDIAEKRLTELEEMLEEINRTASRLQNDQTALFHRQLEQEKEAVRTRLHAVQDKAQALINRGVQTMDSDYLRREQQEDVVGAAEELQRYIDSLSSGKMQELRALYDSILSERIRKYQQDQADRADGIVRIDENTARFLNGITDEVLRQFTYLAYLKEPELSGDELLKAGKRLRDTTVADRERAERERIRRELEASHISHEKIDEIVTQDKSLSEVQSEATSELVEEQVRKKSLSIIKKAIMARGFIIDKKNIRLDPKTNEVTMVALKASGEKATFRVFLDGRFIYDFRGYEGQACQKDIESFMSDLEEVYGIHVKAKTEIWSNPDKIATMKYQAMNTNKNKG